MRTAFVDALLDLARTDRRIVLVTGDLGFGVLTQFMTDLPQQFINVGVAEQNMTGLAAGLALSGKIAFTYSIANFPVIRCLEQVRNDVCYHRANVKIVAVGGGMAYGSLGMTHHATEDLAIMRALPEMTVMAPNDPVEAALATRAAVAYEGPCYLRLGRAGEPVVHERPPDFHVGRAIRIRDGDDLTFIVTGGLLTPVLVAADGLSARGVRARVLSMHTIKPLDVQAICAAAAETGVIATVEEHTVIGGLGGAVAEVLAERAGPVVFRRVGLPDRFTAHVGDQEYLRAQSGLDATGILATVNELLAAKAARARGEAHA